jgi:hypothetical protein
VPDVGQLIATGTPEYSCFSRIESLLQSPQEFTHFVERTQDKRMSREQWTHTLNFELLMLYKWAIRRYLLASSGSSVADVPKKEDRALVLLPRYGYALHALRRVAPLSALGVETLVSVPSPVLQDAARPLNAVAVALGLKQTFRLSREEPGRSVEHFARDKAPIFLTGRRSTFENIRELHPGIGICGATGTCSVIVGSKVEACTHLQRRMHERELAVSCSNHGLSVVCDNITETAECLSISGGNMTSTTRGYLVEEIKRVHPSIILALDADSETYPRLVAGYTVWSCTSDGEPQNHEGFARDPVCGWPGDYLT